MRKQFLIGLHVGMLACGGVQAAESTLTVSGSVRARFEALQGQYRPGFDERDDLLALRSTLLAEWRHAGWRLVGELFDSRAYDTDAGSVLTANEVNVLEPVQAYVQRDLRDPFGAGSSAALYAGRFTLNIGSRRLVASDDYRNTPQGYTGVRVEARTAGRTQVSAFYVLPHQRRPDDFASVRHNEWELDHEGSDLQLWGLLAAQPALLPGGVMGEVGYIGLQERDHGTRATRNRQLDHITLRALREPAAGAMDFELEGIHQWGDIRASTAPAAAQLDVSAWFVHAEIGYTWRRAGKPHLSVEFDHATGDGPGSDYQRFDTLFGMRRADLAPSGIFGAVGRTNLQSTGVRLEITPSSRLDAFAAWRWLRAADRTDSFSTTGIRDVSGASGERAGALLDARVRYWLVPQRWRAEVNGVWLKRGQLLRDAPNASPWGDPLYGSLAVTFQY